MMILKSEYQNRASGDSGGLSPKAVTAVYDRQFTGGLGAICFCGWHPTYNMPQAAELIAIGDPTNGCVENTHYLVQEAGGSSDSGVSVVATHLLTDNDVLTSTNGGNLLALANKFKDVFFAGETQTAATLFEYMREKYGAYVGFFATVSLSTGFEYIKDPQGIHDGDWANIDINYAHGEALSFNQIYPNNISFGGDEYGNIVSAYPSMVETDQDKSNFVVASLIFGDINPVDDTHLHFDVYIDGTDSPTLDVRWKAITKGDNFSLQTVAPHVYNSFQVLTEPNPPYGASEGDTRVHPILWTQGLDPRYFVDNGFTWSGSYHTTYLSLFDSRTSNYSALEKKAYFGADGIANALDFCLQFQERQIINNAEVMTYGQAFNVHIPKQRSSDGECIVSEIANSQSNTTFTTTVSLHFNAPPTDPSGGGGNDDPSITPPPYTPTGQPDFDPHKPTGFGGHSILTQTYALVASGLENIGSKLWSQSYWDVLKIQSNPIENIISCKWYPFSLTGADADIIIGNINFGYRAPKISNIYHANIGSHTYTISDCEWKDGNNKTHSLPAFMCCSPFTTVKLHLPYAGTVQIDASEYINKKLSIELVIDLITGDLLYLLYMGSNNAPYMTVAGKCGVDIPLTASNRAQTELASASKQLSAVLGAAGSLMGGNVVGAAQSASSIVSAAGMDFSCQRTATHSPACASYENKAIYIEFSFPKFVESEGFKNSHGYPAHKWTTLSSCKGFVKVDNVARLNIAMTEEENRMIEALLTEGIYV